MVNDSFERTLKQAADSFFSLPGTCYVTYFPALGPARRIKAVIDHQDVEDGREAVEILVKNDSSSGIASAEINTGGDKVEISQRMNKRPVRMSVVEIIHHDAAMLKLKLV
jgi:hypothetical protein